ncbi:MAG TPA: TonB-dependent siderophore receptor, partial [Flavobacteriaceae bacterium]|nr:TonB-dependent siderophore receptor [Flavobacteriaceae bacterium]
MKKNTLLLLTILSVVTMYGQAGSIKGKIVTNENIAIPEVNVKILNTTKGTTTDNTGVYEITNLEKGSYKLEVSYLGFKTLQKNVTIYDNESVTVDFTLQESNTQLQ